MNTVKVLRCRVFWLYIVASLFLASTLSANFVLVNDNVLNDKVTTKIEEMANELHAQTGISAYVAAPKTLEQVGIVAYAQQMIPQMKKPFVLLTIAKNDHQVDIFHSQELEGKYDKEAILSPYPWRGTIIPLLTGKKDNDQYNAATLNGFADLVERIAKTYGVSLQSALGNTNRNILFIVKIGIYGFLLFVIVGYYLKKVRRKNV
ncbi:MAG: TPM domain-containing protein [Sulfurospirillum sp.]|nr:TPM domain-containing protein [Sulfurospirillum sp.]